jgi:hypothetical protein
MNFTNRKERVPERRVPSPQLLLLRLQHLRAVLQCPTHLKKVINISLGRGGYKKPPLGKNESLHKLPVRKKMKNIVQEEEDHRVKSDINSFSLKYMELEADIEKMFPNIDQLGEEAHHNPSLEIVENEIFDEDESFVF